MFDIEKIATLSSEQCRDFYKIAYGAMYGNKDAFQLITEVFGEPKTAGDLYMLTNECYKRLTPADRRLIDADDERDIQKVTAEVNGYIHPNGDGSVPESITKKIKDESVSPLLIHRLNAGMTQAQLAEASGINRVQISRIERGEINTRNITLANAIKLAKALGITAEDLLSTL